MIRNVEASPFTKQMVKVGFSPIQVEALQAVNFPRTAREHRHTFDRGQRQALADASDADSYGEMFTILARSTFTRTQARVIASYYSNGL